jgi:hypothetical protein
MNCECKKDYEAKISENLKGNLPEGSTEFTGELDCYGLGIDDHNNFVTALMIPFKGSVMVPKNSGGMKKQKVQTFLKASFCPFCGKAAD